MATKLFWKNPKKTLPPKAKKMYGLQRCSIMVLCYGFYRSDPTVKRFLVGRYSFSTQDWGILGFHCIRWAKLKKPDIK